MIQGQLRPLHKLKLHIVLKLVYSALQHIIYHHQVRAQQ